MCFNTGLYYPLVTPSIMRVSNILTVYSNYWTGCCNIIADSLDLVLQQRSSEGFQFLRFSCLHMLLGQAYQNGLKCTIFRKQNLQLCIQISVFFLTVTFYVFTWFDKSFNLINYILSSPTMIKFLFYFCFTHLFHLSFICCENLMDYMSLYQQTALKNT